MILPEKRIGEGAEEVVQWSSCRGPDFAFQYLCEVAYNCLYLDSSGLMPLVASTGTVLTCDIHPHRHTHIHINDKSKY